MREENIHNNEQQGSSSPRSPKSPQRQIARNMQVYYEMVNNYIYENVDYTKLVTERLNSSQKNFVKLITKSPFLFNA